MLSRGHAAGALYIALWSVGRLEDEDLCLTPLYTTRFRGFQELLSPTPFNPAGLETTSSRTSTCAKNLIACVLLSLLVSACFVELLRNPNDLLTGRHFGGRNDMTHAGVGYRVFPNTPIREFGQLPFWNPYSLTGIPWYSNPQSSLFYPGYWLFLLFDGIPLISWLLVAHHWFAGVGMYFLCRRYRFSWLAALFGGSAFAATPYLIAHSAEGHFPHACLIAWFPWAFLCFERLRCGQRGAVPLLACIISLCFFCGHVQEVYYLVLVLTGFLVCDVAAGIRRPSEISAVKIGSTQRLQANTVLEVPVFHQHLSPPRQLLVNWIGVGALTVGLVAIDLLPIGIYTTRAVRSAGISAEKAGKISLGLPNLRQLVDPLALGDMQSYGAGYYWETVFHFGIVVSLLAVIGTCFGFRRFPVQRMIALFLIGAVFAFGANTPFFAFCYNFIPGISFFRVPSRSIFFCAFTISVLSAVGVDVLLAAATKLHLSGRVRLTRIWKTGVAALTVVGAAELAMFSNSLFTTVPQDSFHRQNEIIDFLKQHAAGSRVFALQDHLSDYEAWTRGIQKVQGYAPVPLKRYNLFTAAMVQPHDPGLEMAGFETVGLSHYKKPLLDLLGVKYAIVASVPETPLVGWKVVKQGRIPQLVTLRGQPVKSIPYAILENENPLPRAFVIGQTRILHPADKIIDVLGQFDPRKELLLENDLQGTGDRAKFSAAAIEEYTPNRIRLSAELSEPGYLVLTDAFYPGWSARVDGNSAPIIPADFAFRAVPLAAGQHEVVFTFSPPLFKIGLVITGFTAVLVVIALAVAAFGNGHAAGTKDEVDDPDPHFSP